MKPLLEPPLVVTSQVNLQYAEPHVVDFQLLKEGPNGTRRQELFDVLRAASPTGLLHLVNHGLEPDLFHTLRAVTYTYMMTTSQEEKDKAETVQGTGSFEGYKPRTAEEKERGIVPVIEEYNYDYRSSGRVTRPKTIEENEHAIRQVFDFYHHELTPNLLDAIDGFLGSAPGTLRQLHEDSSEVAHLLLYHPGWYNDDTRRRAAYAGHTDIGSVTYLYANPVATLQVYGPRGWEYVAYIPNSIVINMGDAMQFLTTGRVQATLHRVIKPTAEQDKDARTALVYFVHPGHRSMSASLRFYRQLRAKHTAETKAKPGSPIDGFGLNRVISAISAMRDDAYLCPVDSSAWEASRRGGMVASPKEFTIDFETLVTKPVH